MIDFVPVLLYTQLFNYLILFLVVMAAVQGFSGTILQRSTAAANSAWGTLLVVIIILYMGLRPVSYVFGDTINYARTFYQIKSENYVLGVGSGWEWLFDYLMKWFAKNSDIYKFFLLCSVVYVGALWWAIRRIFGDYYYIPLLVAMSMFTFWAYGVNGIRNGMASSLIILALSFRRNIPIASILCILALGCHKSVMITVAAAVLTIFITNSKIYLWGWFASIIVSAATGNFVANILTSIGLGGDDRMGNYMNSTEFSGQFSNTGFRWDFLVYSAIPIMVGWYFIFKRNYTDKFYIWLFNIYLITNSFWVLVIRAEFSNRFAQLSWFIMPLVLIYPFFMKQFWGDQQQKIGWAILAFYAFTFYFNILK